VSRARHGFFGSKAGFVAQTIDFTALAAEKKLVEIVGLEKNCGIL
jgi:hypothetical protein